MWLEQATAWFNSALQSGMLALGGIGGAGIFAGAKAWLGSITANKSINTLKATVMTQEQTITEMYEMMRLLLSRDDAKTKIMESQYIVLSKFALATNIPMVAKNEIIELNASTLPLFKTPDEIKNQLDQLGQSITNPIPQAQQVLDEQKQVLQATANAKLDETKTVLSGTLEKLKSSVVGGLDSLKGVITDEKQA